MLHCNIYCLKKEVSGGMRDNKPSTKTKIFNGALRLFATKGVENATMRGIAAAAGINIASIYNYYTSKEQIVDECYDFFLKYYDGARLSEEQCRAVLKNGTKEEIMNVPIEPFPEEREENLGYAMTILFSRIYTDSKAIEKYTEMINHSLQFLKRFLELGIDLGRFEKFDVNRVALLFLSARLFAAQSITIFPEALGDMGLNQQEMMQELKNNIPFKY